MKILVFQRYQAVFGPNLQRQSVDLDSRNRAMVNSRHFQEQEETLADEDNSNPGGYIQVSSPFIFIISFFSFCSFLGFQVSSRVT